LQIEKVKINHSASCKGLNNMALYQIIYADPPWDYAGQTQHGKTKASGGAKTHYPTMKLAELKALPVASLADADALLFMWTSSPHLDQALELLTAWGFKYATIAFV
jgi:N6-adenosine-specific RNA methylase IME4